MSALAHLPIDILIDHLLPALPVSGVLRLTCTNKFFATICSDDTFWKRRLATDFNFNGAGTARTSGWKFIYRGLLNPAVYVWGERSNGRLGLRNFPKSTLRDVPFPVNLEIPGVRIVSLIAGGMSFHALDSQGRIFVWGTLNGEQFALGSDGFSASGKSSITPARLQLPVSMRSISCGRLHMSSLDADGGVWTFVNWGRPFLSSSPLLTDPTSKIVQVECGWMFSSALTQWGDVFVWWPFSGTMQDRIDSMNAEMDMQPDKKAVLLRDGTVPCATWTLETNPVRLPTLPPLPELLPPVAGKEQEPIRLIKIAGLDCHLIGLTNHGHVLKFNGLESEMTASQGAWQYLPKFSEVDKVRDLTAFSESGIEPPATMHIAHISANFLTFVAYSTGSNSVVLTGYTDTVAHSDPKVIPGLQNRNIISMELGDFHNVALTSTGKVLTWGNYSAGALGLGDPATLTPGTPGAFVSEERRLMAVQYGRGEPPAVQVPTEVRFDHGRKNPKDRFCFAVTAAGWHTGALVIDLEPDPQGKEDEDEIAYETHEPPQPSWSRTGRWFPTGEPGQTPPIIPFPGLRVGFAGRGRGRGS